MNGNDLILPPRLVLYDGSCGLCHRSVRWLLNRDRDAVLMFAPLGGETAALAGSPALPPGAAPDTIIFVRDGKALIRSRAIFALLGDVRSGWRWLRVFRFLPAWLTDLPYRLVARIRHRIFGHVDACSLPAPAERARFLP